MKYNQELIDWFNNYFYNCYYVKHDNFPDSIFMCYDIKYVRQLKLAKLEGKDYVEKTNITGVCVFEQDWKNKWFGCNYTLIYSYLRDIYSFSYDDFQAFIKDRLEEHSKMNVLTPNIRSVQAIEPLEEHSKMNVLTPTCSGLMYPKILEEHSKMNVLTPHLPIYLVQVLEEHSKMNVLTPKSFTKTPSI